MHLRNPHVVSPIATCLALLVLTVPHTFGAAKDACDLVLSGQVAEILGNNAPIARHQSPMVRDGVTVSSCVYQSSSGGNTGNVQFNTYESVGAADTGLKQYVAAMVKLGATTDADTVDRLPATFITSKHGTGEMYVVKGNVLLGAGVAGVSPTGGVMPLRDRSRTLLSAALSKL